MTSKDDVRKVIEAEVKEEDTTLYRLEYGRIESRIHEEKFVNVCAEVKVLSRREMPLSQCKAVLLNTELKRKNR